MQASTRGWRLRRSIAFGLELLVAIYGLGLVLFLLGINLGALTPDRAEKPVLLILLVLPLRFTLGGESWLLETVRRAAPRPAFVRWLSIDRLPPSVVDSAIALLATRVAGFTIGFVANLIYTPAAARSFVMPFHYTRFMEIFAAWDSGWYFDIARHGYYWRPDGQSSVAFFPLYPMLMRAVAWPFGGSDRAVWAAGIGVSCAAFALALVVLHRFTMDVSGSRQVARRAVLYAAVFPFSLFFTRVYAESVFLLTTVIAVREAWRGRWWTAGISAGLAAVARPNGILIAIPLALLAFERPSREDAGTKPRAREIVQRLMRLWPIAATFAGYCAFVYSLSGDPLGWLNAQAQWGYSLGHPPWQLLLGMLGRLMKHGIYDYFFLSPLAPFRFFHGVVALVFLALTPAVFKRLGVPMGAYVLASLLVPLSGNALEGIGRYAAVLFPFFMLAATVKSPRAHEAILISASMFHALFICLFVTLRPIY